MHLCGAIRAISKPAAMRLFFANLPFMSMEVEMMIPGTSNYYQTKGKGYYYCVSKEYDRNYLPLILVQWLYGKKNTVNLSIFVRGRGSLGSY